jgi:hypothetical protein
MPNEWTIELSSGASLRFHIVRPQAGAYMGHTVALLTDAVLTGGASMARDIEGGLAVSGSAVTGRFVSAAPAQVTRVMQVLAGRLSELERRAIADWRGEMKKSDPPLPSVGLVPDLPKGRFRETTLLTAVRPFREELLSYFSADKIFTMQTTVQEYRGCGLNLSFEGVVVANKQGKTVRNRIEGVGFANYCGDRGVWMEPVATVEWQGRLGWLARYMMEDGFDFIMYDPLTGKSIPPR